MKTPCRKSLLFLGVCVILVVIGCIMPAVKVAKSPVYDASTLGTVAVWRFRDGGKIENSGDIATRAVENALMMNGFRLVAYSQVQNVLAVDVDLEDRTTIDAGILTPSDLKKIKEEADVDAVITGSVSDCWCNLAYIPPCWFACSFQMIATATGEILVSASASDDAWSIEGAAEQVADKAVKMMME